MKFLSKKAQKTTFPSSKTHFFPDLYKDSLNERDEVNVTLTESNHVNLNSNQVYSYKSFL